MNLDFLSTLILIVLSSIVCIVSHFNVLGLKRSKKLPPGPYPWPVIGNLLQLGENPHKSIAKLSKTYGPLMHLKLGTVHMIVASSPEIAREILQKHDKACSGRAVPDSARALNHDCWSFTWSQVGTAWHRFRKICKVEMFSTPPLISTEQLRAEKMEQMRNYIKECCNNNRAVNIGEVAFITSLNLMWNTLFSSDFGDLDSESSREMMQLVHGAMKVLGIPNVSDYFPILRRFDLQGIRLEAEGYFRKFLIIFDEIISKRLKSRDTSSHKIDLLEALIGINQENNDVEFSHNDITHLFLDLILGGVDITPNIVEWAMTELFRNPEKLTKAKDELGVVIGHDKQVQESDIPKLLYLNAVIKETLRLHPPGPFPAPHKAESDVEINGFTIPKDAKILVNIWAICMDSKVWPDPERFEPERFLERNIDYRGKDLELIPFGSGRRMCPGLPLAHLMLHVMLGSLIHGFDWRIDDDDYDGREMRSTSLDVSEEFGLTLHKVMPLMAYPSC